MAGNKSKKRRVQERQNKKLAKQAKASFPSVAKQPVGKRTIITEASNQLDRDKRRANEAVMRKRSNRNADGMTINYDTFAYEFRAVPENKDTKTRYVPHGKKTFKLHGKN